MGLSILFTSSFMAACAAAIAILFAGFSPLGGLGIYTFVGAAMMLAWIAELAYSDQNSL